MNQNLFCCIILTMFVQYSKFYILYFYHHFAMSPLFFGVICHFVFLFKP